MVSAPVKGAVDFNFTDSVTDVDGESMCQPPSRGLWISTMYMSPSSCHHVNVSAPVKGAVDFNDT